MGVTIKDVAKKTGVSVTTVSLVLNKKTSRISEKTRQLIEEAARELNYVPNQTAVSLVTKKTQLIGMIVPADTYYQYSDFIRSVEYACKNAGYYLNISLAEHTPESIGKQIQALMRYNVDGIILDPSLLRDPSDSLCEMIRNQSIPIVSTDQINNQALPNAILPDHKRGAYIAAEYLLELGHTSIGLITGPDSLSITASMVQGYREALESYHIPFAEDKIYCGSYHLQTGYSGAEQLINEYDISAVITASDAIAYGVYKYANDHHLVLGKDLSLITYGSGSLIDTMGLPLTSVSIHLDRIARKSVNLIRSYNHELVNTEVIEPTLIERGSTGRKL
ncbi:MAG: LacI family DNA-binding transcriptional regulator [Solobacterium sp.]|nr:LacI family DNA-binding transcriptional regulator [Solobacterium sp.]